MSIQRFVVDVDIDDEMLAEHDGNEQAPPNDITDWECDDIGAGERMSIVDGMEIVEYMGEVKPDEEG